MPITARSTIAIPSLCWRRARLNAPLAIGGLLLIFLVVCALAAPLLAPHSPFAVTVGAPGEKGPPYPPLTPGYLLGSDPAGRDMLSRLLYGGRYTLLFCAIAGIMRVAVELLLGMIAGWYERAGAVIAVVASKWSAVPSLLVAAIIIAMLGRGAGRDPLTIPPIALAVTGWTEVATRCQIAVQELRAVAFIDAAYAIGGRRWSILWRHVLPNIRGRPNGGVCRSNRRSATVDRRAWLSPSLLGRAGRYVWQHLPRSDCRGMGQHVRQGTAPAQPGGMDYR